MKLAARPVALALLVAALAGLAAWWANENMELRWRARVHLSDAARENPMLAATLLLRQQGYGVTVAGTLGELALPSLPPGTLLIGEPHGMMTGAHAQELLAWVRHGNTLITRPRHLPNAALAAPAGADQAGMASDNAADADSAPLERDPIGARLGLHATDAQQQLRRCDPAGAALVPTAQTSAYLNLVRLACLSLDGASHPLEVDTGSAILVSSGQAATPAARGLDGEAVRVYREGKGRIVMLASNYFSNHRLQRFDHAELLLALAGLNQASRQVTIVHRLDVLPWYQGLWRHFWPALVGVGVALALSLWMALRRFGPLLPEAAHQRRSLIEHIDASGAWLWTVPGGREVLLAAARHVTLSAVLRRAPELQALAAPARAAALAGLTGLPAGALQAALLAPAAARPRDFTNQVRTLLQLRKHYAR